METRFLKARNIWANKTKITTYAGVALLAIASIIPSVASAFSGTGAGTLSNPYQITSCEQLQSMLDELDAVYILTTDIDCSATASWNSGAGFAAIGTSVNPFTGLLDGQGFTITGLTINRSTTTNQGLIGYTDGGLVQNISLLGGDIFGRDATGSVVGYALNADITNVRSTATVQAQAGANIGGLVGRASSTNISNSSYIGTISQTNDVSGGIAGRLINNSSITDSYSKGTLNVQNDVSGGLAGYVTTSSITHSYSAMNITAGTTGMMGGIAGYFDGSTLTDVFSDSTLTHTDSNSHGGVIGYRADTISTSTITNAYYNKSACGCAVGVNYFMGSGPDVATAVNVSNATPDYFKSNNTNAPLNNWNFTTAWIVVSGSQPALRSVEKPADADNDNTASITENAAPNGGDANNDGTRDSAQSNVSSIVSPVSGTYITLVSDCDHTNSLSAKSESGNAVNDVAFDYPTGVVSFSLACTSGATANVSLYVYTPTAPSSFAVRKYNEITKAYSALTSATLQQVTIGGQTAVRVSYQITDGGSLDQDGTVNGTIVDPVGLAAAAIQTPNTGFGYASRNTQ